MSTATPQRNYIPWPSFPNLSVWYAGLCLERLGRLDLTTTDHVANNNDDDDNCDKKRNGNYSLIDDENDNEDSSLLLGNVLDMQVYAYEKLDGTNFGVRCDGMLLGRRERVVRDTYQGVPLKSSLPNHRGRAMQKIKAAMAKAIGEKQPLPQFNMVVYGELMCNPGRFQYEERSMAKQWMCFGIMLAPRPNYYYEKEEVIIMEKLVSRLREHGFFATRTFNEVSSSHARVLLNPKLVALLDEAASLPCCPLVDQGTLRDVCLRLEPEMMNNFTREGVVLTSQDRIFKWKTGKEDESSGAPKLQKLLTRPRAVLEVAGVDVPFAICLARVAGNKPKASPRSSAPRNNIQAATASAARSDPPPYDCADVERALASAMSKYDALEVYFQEGEYKRIKKKLNEEVATDLNAFVPAQRKYIEKIVFNRVGGAYMAWKNQRST